METIRDLATLALIVGVLFLIGAFVQDRVKAIRRAKQQAGIELTDIERAILDFADRWSRMAIFAGEYYARKMFGDANAVLDATHREEVALAMYNAMPEEIDIFGFKIRPREKITFEQWKQIVKSNYEASKSFVLGQDAYLRTLIAAALEDANATRPLAPITHTTVGG